MRVQARIYFYDEFLELIDAKINESREKGMMKQNQKLLLLCGDSYQDISLWL